MIVINVHEAKTNLSKLLTRAAHGERIIIGKAGKPIARLEPITTSSPHAKVTGGGFRLQEKLGHPLTPEEMNRVLENKFE